MGEEFWLKYGFKENGELVCTRMIANSKPTEKFFYTEDGETREVKNPDVVKLTKEVIEKLNGVQK
ncbi:hypothetical protein KY361_02665 [Candidatus Woesearchaeota archaeon]|nr:hypothetical protein [Candidatus Woesearchaeota archaeon]